MSDEQTEFKQALTQVLWDYEPLDSTDLWKDVEKALKKANKDKNNVRKTDAS